MQEVFYDIGKLIEKFCLLDKLFTGNHIRSNVRMHVTVCLKKTKVEFKFDFYYW